MDLGVGGGHVVEFSTALAGLGDGGVARLIFVSSSGAGVDLRNLAPTSNQVPTLVAIAFSVDENAIVAIAVGSFAIDDVSGAIHVADPAALNFETTLTFSLTVSVTDSGTPRLGDTATVSLGDANDAPTAANATPGVCRRAPLRQAPGERGMPLKGKGIIFKRMKKSLQQGPTGRCFLEFPNSSPPAGNSP